jgi:hypothetical protein
MARLWCDHGVSVQKQAWKYDIEGRNSWNVERASLLGQTNEKQRSDGTNYGDNILIIRHVGGLCGTIEEIQDCAGNQICETLCPQKICGGCHVW